MEPAIRVATSGWIWLLGSWAVAVVCANLAWAWRRAPAGALGRAVRVVVAWPYSGWLLQAARLLYYVGLPFAALVWGHDAVNARLLGLQRVELPLRGAAGAVVAENWLDWLRDVGWAAALGVGVWAVLALAWWRLRRVLIGTGLRVESAPAPTASPWVLLREAVFHEAHWAFYRNAPILGLGSTYWGTWVALAVVGLEALLNPAWRERLRSPAHNIESVMRVALAVVSSALFLETANLWLAVGVHSGVSLGLAAFTRALPLPGTAASSSR